MREENNLKLASFFFKHKKITESVAVATDITLDNVRLLRELKEREKEHKYPLVSPVIDANNWPKTMELLGEYLREDIGFKGVPLSYVVISEEAVAPILDEPETSFSSDEYEMVARAPILEGGLRTLSFKTDMMKVWGLISVITRDLD